MMQPAPTRGRDERGALHHDVVTLKESETRDDTMIEWLNVQTPTVQAAVYAAGIAMAGVIVNNIVALIGIGINNHVAQRKTALELEHDREQKKAERKLTLRRDIYLGLAAHILDGINAITAWADLGLEHKDIVEARRRNAKYLAQVHLMAGPPMVEAVAACNRAIDQAIIRVRIGRDKLLAIQARMRNLRSKIDAHRLQASAAFDMVRTKGLTAPIASDEYERLKNIATAEEAQAQTLAIEHDQILDDLRVQKWQLFCDALERQRETYVLALAVVSATRVELGESIDMSVYQKVLGKDDAGTAELRLLFGLPPETE